MTGTGIFNWQRLGHLLVIEFNNYWKKVALASGMVFAILLFLYTDISDETGNGFSDGIFLIITIAGGAIFTSVIFNDMHHPLEKFHYLTLPCSQQERFASKYLITGPLFLLYALVLSGIFKGFAPAFVAAFNSSPAPFDPFDDFPALYAVILFFSVHIVFFLGAILFRGFAVVKTGFCLFILPYTFFFVALVSLKIFYADHFDSFLSINTNRDILPGIQVMLLRSDTFMFLAWIALYLWFITLAYSCLKDHEA